MSHTRSLAGLETGGLEKFQVMQRCNREGSGPGHLKKGAVSPHFDVSPFIDDPGQISKN